VPNDDANPTWLIASTVAALGAAYLTRCRCSAPESVAALGAAKPRPSKPCRDYVEAVRRLEDLTPEQYQAYVRTYAKADQEVQDECAIEAARLIRKLAAKTNQPYRKLRAEIRQTAPGLSSVVGADAEILIPRCDVPGVWSGYVFRPRGKRFAYRMRTGTKCNCPAVIRSDGFVTAYNDDGTVAHREQPVGMV